MQGNPTATMKYLHFILSIFLSLTIASISIQVFDSLQCSGDQVANVLSNGGNQNDDSDCVATTGFQSAIILSADPGFVCNLFSTTTCGDSFKEVTLNSTEVGSCFNIIGMGVDCLNEGLLSNPLADSTASITIGKNKITTALNSSDVAHSLTFPEDVIKQGIGIAINQACSSETGCDPVINSPLALNHQTCETFEIQVCNTDATCEQTITVEGNFDNVDTRDYMRDLLLAVLAKTHVFNDGGSGGILTAQDGGGGIETFNLVSFVQVIINDAKGGNQAEMTVRIAFDCTAVSPTDSGCNVTVKTLVDAALGAVPDFGGVAAAAFDLPCDGFS